MVVLGFMISMNVWICECATIRKHFRTSFVRCFIEFFQVVVFRGRIVLRVFGRKAISAEVEGDTKQGGKLWTSYICWYGFR